MSTEFINLLYTMKLHTQKITCMAFSNKSDILVTGGADKMINIVDIKTFQKVCSFEAHIKPITDIKIIESQEQTNNNTTLLCTSSLDCTLKMFGIKNKKIEHIFDLKGHKTSVISIEIVNNYILSLDVEGIIIRWNMNGMLEEVIQSFDNATQVNIYSNIKCMVLHSENTLLVSDRSKVFLFDYVNKKETKKVLNEPASSIKIKNNHFVVCLKDKIVVYDANLNEIESITVMGDKIQSGCILNDKTLMVGTYQQIIRYSTFGNLNMKAHDNIVSCLESITVFDIEYIISCSYDGSIKIWIENEPITN
ncbi:hypothetical protein BDAP_001330 [Binucleata daphniae]